MRQQYVIIPETVLGIDKRGEFIRYADFQKDYNAIKRIVTLNSRGKEIMRKAKFYKIHRMRKTHENQND